MKKLLKVLLVSMFLFSLVACSDSSSKYHVGVIQLAKHSALDAATQGFVDELTKEFGDEIYIDVQNANGDADKCSIIVDGFVSDNVDLIMANATPALQAAAARTNSIPILGTSVTEYGQALGIENFAGFTNTNISGTSDLANLEQQAQLILDLVKDVKKVGILYCSSEANSLYQVNIVEKYLQAKGIEVARYSFTETDKIAMVTKECCENVDAIYVPTDNMCADNGETIDGVARNAGIPIVTGEEATAKLCGIATQTISYYELGVITGKMAARVLKGEDISKMEIEYYSDYYTEAKKYNKTICEELGIEVPSDFEAIE